MITGAALALYYRIFLKKINNIFELEESKPITENVASSFRKYNRGPTSLNSYSLPRILMTMKEEMIDYYENDVTKETSEQCMSNE